MRRRSRIRAIKAEEAAAQQRRDQTAGWVTLLTGILVTTLLFIRNRQPMTFSEYNVFNTALLLGVPLLILLVVLRREPSDFGMTAGDLRGGLVMALLLFLPFVQVILFIAPMKPPQQYYISWLSDSRAVTGAFWSPQGWTGGRIDPGRLAYHELIMGFYMFAWEWYYRGFLLFGLKRVMPVPWAVFLQAAAFTLLHYGKPLPEMVSSFPGGIILALLALRYRSFLPCFFLHFAISMAFDAAVLYYHFHPGARTLLGGRF